MTQPVQRPPNPLRSFVDDAPDGMADRFALIDDMLGAMLSLRLTFDEIAEAEGLNHLQAQLIRTLNEPLPQRTIAEGLGCDPSYVTAIVDDLQARGVVQRSVDPADRRRRLVGLTEEGAQVRANLMGRFADQRPGQDLDDGEVAELRRLLSKLRTS